MFGSLPAATPGEVVQIGSAPVPHAKCENVRSGRLLTIEATVSL
jgi:hypothetical protein